MGMTPRPVAPRFWSRVDTSAGLLGCWPWLGDLNDRGYGRIRVNGRKEYAHRVAYELANGPIPVGLDVLHSCDNPPCCNPAHLSPGTRSRNSLEAVLRRRHPSLVLTPELVVEIRALGSTGLRPTAIGRRLGLTRHVVQDVLLGRSWQHVA